MRRRLATATPQEVHRALLWGMVTAHSPRRSRTQCLKPFERDGQKRCSDCEHNGGQLLMEEESELYGGSTWHTHLPPNAPCITCDELWPCLVWTAMQAGLPMAPTRDDAPEWGPGAVGDAGDSNEYRRTVGGCS